MVIEIFIFLFVITTVFLIWNRTYGQKQAILNMVVMLGVAIFSFGISTGNNGSSFIGLVVSIIAIILLANIWYQSRY